MVLGLITNILPDAWMSLLVIWFFLSLPILERRKRVQPKMHIVFSIVANLMKKFERPATAPGIIFSFFLLSFFNLFFSDVYTRSSLCTCSFQSTPLSSFSSLAPRIYHQSPIQSFSTHLLINYLHRSHTIGSN